MAEKNRRITPKGLLVKMVGRKIDPNILPAIHKVQIMEYLLTCPISQLVEYRESNIPTFIHVSAKMLVEGRIPDYMSVLNQCRIMAREDALNAK